VEVVEYLNPFCAHCRATYERLQRVLASFPSPVRVRRVYVWTTRDVPLWAKGCACAREQSREPSYFGELVRLPRDTESEARAAASRAGLDVARWSACVLEPDTLVPLSRMHAAVDAAGIRLLPTIDVGRRRLNGEQSEDELREALEAALSE
jgi:predicted DsbA family dithiol-disulfide isomerase